MTYWFEVVGEDSDFCGEEFFVEVGCFEEDPLASAWDVAVSNFPDEELECHGKVSFGFAEMMGYDTY